MSANVISHRAPHRKPARSSMARRAGVVIVAIAGVIFASLLASAPDRVPTPQHLPSPVAQSPAPAPAMAVIAAVDTATDLSRAPLPRRFVRSVRQTGVPLDADAALEPAGYEILSAAELDGISQARD